MKEETDKLRETGNIEGPYVPFGTFASHDRIKRRIVLKHTRNLSFCCQSQNYKTTNCSGISRNTLERSGQLTLWILDRGSNMFTVWRYSFGEECTSTHSKAPSRGSIYSTRTHLTTVKTRWKQSSTKIHHPSPRALGWSLRSELQKLAREPSQVALPENLTRFSKTLKVLWTSVEVGLISQLHKRTFRFMAHSSMSR